MQQLDTFGLFAASMSASYRKGSVGLQAYAAFEADFLGFNIHASTRREISGGYRDLEQNPLTLYRFDIRTQRNSWLRSLS